MLLFIPSALSAASDPQILTFVNGDACFPALGPLQSLLLFLMVAFLLAFAVLSFYAMLKVYLQPSQVSVLNSLSSSSGDRDPASFIARREWEIES